MNNDKKVAIVTGGSSGIGLEAVRMLIGRGWTVYNMSRRECTVKGAISVRASVCDAEAVRSTIAQIATNEGHIDALICSAGIGIAGAVEEFSDSEVRDQFETNFFGLDNCVRAVLPTMRAQGHGNIIAVSSIMSVIPLPYQTYYCATKAAVWQYCLGLQTEVEPFGINVCCVMPGDTKTGFTSQRRMAERAKSSDSPYKHEFDTVINKCAHDEEHGVSAESVATQVVKEAEAKRPHLFNVTGLEYKLYYILRHTMPLRLALKVIRKLYT